MAGKGSVLINFRADASKAIRETRKFARSLNDVDGTSKKVSRGLSSMAKVGIGAVAAGAATAGYALWNMVEGAVADDAAQRRLAKSLKLTADATDAQVSSVEEWITAQGRALGITDEELRPALARLARSTEDVGKAQELATIAMDIAAATGKPLSAVAAAVAKAWDGNTGALARLGIKLDEGPGKWATLAESVKGSAEDQASTVEGSMTRIKTAIGEAGESVGAALLPSLQELADWLSSPEGTEAVENFAQVTEDFGKWVSEELPREFAAASEALTGPGSFYENLMQIQDLLADITNAAFKFTHGGKSSDDLEAEKESLRRKAVRDRAEASAWLVPKGTGGDPRGKRVLGGGTVIVNVTNGKQEKAIDSAAAAIRLAKVVRIGQ